MRAGITLLVTVFITCCSKAVPPAPTPAEKLAAIAEKIDRQLLEIENQREGGRVKFNQAPRPDPFAASGPNTARKPVERALPPRIPTHSAAPDAAFLRRSYLDTVGRIPTAEEARAFLADASADKRAKLIDKLLADPAWAQQRFQQLASLFRVQDEVLGASQKPYIDWLRAVVEKNMPFDELVRTLLTASGNLETNPATGFLLRDHGWMPATVTEAAWAFLGADLICAHCHDHPFADWTQMQVYQLAACFGATKVTVGALESDEGTRTPKKTASPLFPGAKKVGGTRAKPSSKPTPPATPNELWPASTAQQRALREIKLSADAQLEITDVRSGSVLIPSDYKYKNASPGERVVPDVLVFSKRESGNAIHERIRIGPGDGRSLRADFAEWLVTHEHFAQTFARRIWNSLFIEPRPQAGFEPLRDAISLAAAERASMANMLCNTGCGAGPNPERWGFALPANDVALQNMARLLGNIARETRFDARELQRILMNTKAYQRSAITLPMGEQLAFLPAPLLRRMSADQMWDSLVALGGEAALNEGVDEEMRFTRDLPQTPTPQHSLRLLGRGARDWPEDSVAPVSFGLTRWMMNSQPVTRAANVSGTTLKKIDDLFLATLGRPPTATERSAAEQHLVTDPSDMPSIAWALLNTGEFLFVQ